MTRYPEHIMSAAILMRRDGCTYDRIAAELHVSKRHIRLALKAAIGETPRARTRTIKWTDQEMRMLVKLAPTGLGAFRIAERIGTKTPDQIYARAKRDGIVVVRARDRAPAASVDMARPDRPYESEAVFLGISFLPPTDRPVRGVARPTRGPGRVPMRPATRVVGVSPLGAIASGGE